MPDRRGRRERAELEVTQLAAGGDGIARADDGRVVFVPGALPGERVEVTFTETRRDYARARVDRIAEPSADRVAPPCPFVASGCGGCDWQHIAVAAQPAYKRDVVIDALRRIGRIEEPAVAPCVALPATGYRTALRFAVDHAGRPCFRHARSHDLVAVDACVVAHPLLRDVIARGRWPGAREVAVRASVATGEIQIDLRPRAAGAPAPAPIEEEVAGRRYRVSPGAFFQVRPDGAAALAHLVVQALRAHGAASVVDLYAGVGLFAGAAHDAGIAVVAAVEGSHIAAQDLRHNAASFCATEEADVAAFVVPAADAVIADPSRAGLGRDGVAAATRAAPALVVLVSCDVAAAGRDARLLAAAGYGLAGATPVDLFPHTSHVELVSAFVRL